MSTRQSIAAASRGPLLWLLGACAVVAGCGDPTSACTAFDAGSSDSGSAVSAELAPFVGRWTFKTGTRTTTCGLDAPLSSMPNDQITITPGPVPETITVDDDGCVLTYNVMGTVAASPLSGTCGGAAVETTIEVQQGGLLHFSGVTGVALDGGECTVTVDGYLARR